MTTPAERLLREPFAFEFFQAVRLLEALHPDRRPVGREGPPEAEAVRLTAHPDLAFPASQIAALDADPAGGPPRMAVTFIGLTGPTGVLPPFYTQAVMDRERSGGDPERGALRAWLDLFTHRFASLFYRAWAKYRLPVTFEQAARSGGGPGPIAHAALSLIGLGTPGLAGRLSAGPDAAVDDLSLLRYAGLLVAAARPAVGLETLLADYFGVPVRVDQFRGRWLTLEAENQSRLGRRGQNDRLGAGLMAGRRAWDAQGCFRVRVGPLDYAAFTALLPASGGRRLALLTRLVRFYQRDTLDFEVQLVLRADAVPRLRLTRDGPGPRLGWNTWLGKRAGDAGDAGDAVFRREALTPVPASGGR